MKRLGSVYQTGAIKPFLGSVLVFGIAAGMFAGILNNYLYEVLAITRIERGIIEFPRELPGVLLFVLFGFLYRFSETRLVRAAFFVSLIGMGGMILLGNMRVFAVLLIILWSTGEHMMMPLRQSVAIHSAREGREGLAMGGVASAGNIGQVAGNYLVPLLFILLPLAVAKKTNFTYFRFVFAAAAVVLLIGLLFSSRLADRNLHVKRRKFYFHRKFTKYYILEIFFGARKQIFLTFAPYVLILNYGAKTELISMLYGIWSVSNIIVNPLMGKLLDKIGYKKVIIADSVILLVLCFFYGFSHKLFPHRTAFIVICIVFVLDAMMFAVGMARAMYVRRLSESQDETTSTLSTGLSINHLVSIVIAIVGGILWEVLGIEILFSLAGVFILGAFFFSLTIKKG